MEANPPSPRRLIIAVGGCLALVLIMILAYCGGPKRRNKANLSEEDTRIGTFAEATRDLDGSVVPQAWVDPEPEGYDNPSPTEPPHPTDPSTPPALAQAPVQAQAQGSTPPPGGLAPGPPMGNGSSSDPAQPSIAATSQKNGNSSAASGPPPAGQPSQPMQAPSLASAKSEPPAPPLTGTGPAPGVQGSATPLNPPPMTGPAPQSAGATMAQAGPAANPPPSGEMRGRDPKGPSTSRPTAEQPKTEPTPAKSGGSTPAPSSQALSQAKDTPPPSGTKIGDKPAKVPPQKPTTPVAPVFVKPAKPHPAWIAQTQSLVTKQQLRPNTEVSASANEPARVSQADAIQFAAQATTTLRQTGKLKPTEKVRLPRRSEAKNPAIWHEDDVPTTSTEVKPFGLVITPEREERSPEGIPLRTDIPEGKSALEKTGPDKPLWKRQE